MYSLVTLLLSSAAITSASICCIPPQWEGQVGLLYGMVRNGKVEYSRVRDLFEVSKAKLGH